MTHSPRLPQSPHPVASAFFASHDDATCTNAPSSASASLGKNEVDQCGGGVDRTSIGGRSNKITAPSPGALIMRIRNSAGWRTRYASSIWHPVTIMPVLGRQGRGRYFEGDGDASVLPCQSKNASAPSKFHVRQVFPQHQRNKEESCGDESVDAEVAGEDDVRRDCADERLASADTKENDCKFGTGATVWPGSIVLLKYLERIAHEQVVEEQQDKPPTKRCNRILEGKTVVDLGSGTAITTMAAALLGASLVVCTDGCDPVVELARQNVGNVVSELNGVASCGLLDEGSKTNKFHFRGCKIVVQKYLWGDGTLSGSNIHGLAGEPLENDDGFTEGQNQSIVGDQKKYFDIILCADCIVPKLYPISPLIDALDELSGPETVSFLSYERRQYEHYDPKTEFLRLSKLRHLEVEVIPDDELHPLYPASDIEIWKVSRRKDDSGDLPVQADIQHPQINGHSNSCVGETDADSFCAESNGQEFQSCALTNMPGVENDHASLLVQSHSKK